MAYRTCVHRKVSKPCRGIRHLLWERQKSKWSPEAEKGRARPPGRQRKQTRPEGSKAPYQSLLCPPLGHWTSLQGDLGVATPWVCCFSLDSPRSKCCDEIQDKSFVWEVKKNTCWGAGPGNKEGNGSYSMWHIPIGELMEPQNETHTLAVPLEARQSHSGIHAPTTVVISGGGVGPHQLPAPLTCLLGIGGGLQI